MANIIDFEDQRKKKLQNQNEAKVEEFGDQANLKSVAGTISGTIVDFEQKNRSAD